MSPDEAAHALAGIEEETSSEILEEMTEESKTEVSEIIEYDEHTAGYLMNTEYVALRSDSTVADAIQAMRQNEELLESLNTLFLVDPGDRLTGAVPVARLFTASETTPLKDLVPGTLLQVSVDEHKNRVTGIFDKYNVLTLPVVDRSLRLVGVITADDVISLLRQK
jgi:Mg/Co/Ni transporter MgtE